MDVRVKGLDDATKRVEAIADRLRDLSPVMREIADTIESGAERSVLDRRSPDGSTWAPRSPATQRRHGAYSGRSLAASVFARPTRSGVTYGAEASYAAAIQYGTRHMPARPFLPTGSDRSSDTEQRAAEAIARYVTSGQTR